MTIGCRAFARPVGDSFACYRLALVIGVIPVVNGEGDGDPVLCDERLGQFPAKCHSFCFGHDRVGRQRHEKFQSHESARPLLVLGGRPELVFISKTLWRGWRKRRAWSCHQIAAVRVTAFPPNIVQLVTHAAAGDLFDRLHARKGD